jgi:hypothetical protein
MKAQDLRIGNNIFHRNKAITVNWQELKWIQEENNNFQPIPITEEILLKCGFISGGAKQWLFITLDKKDECYLYFNPLGKGIAIDQNGIEFSFEIELNYLHQLQNIFFALTNEELTINL